MSTAETKQDARKRIRDLQDFTVEMGDDCCRQIMIGTLRTTLRGRWSIGVLHQREGGAGYLGPAMSGMPDIPGIRIQFKFKDMSIRIYDPLEGNQPLLDKINAVCQRARIAKSAPYKHVDEVVKPLDPDKMKTLLYELRQRLEANECFLVDGKFPSRAEVSACEGKELNDPWNSNSNKPKYAEDADEWRKEMEARQT